MDTLFDLDTCTAPVPRAEPAEASALLRKIERYATADTLRAVASIARWNAATPLHPDHPILRETFVGFWPETEYAVRHVVLRADGDITVQFGHGFADSFEVLEMARLTPDGALVDQRGQWMLPKSLCPREVESVGAPELVLTRYHLERAVGRTAQWVLTRLLKNNGLSLHRTAELAALPSQFCLSSTAQLSTDVAAALLADRLADLRNEVAALMAVPLTVEMVRKIQTFFSECARGHTRHDTAAPLEDDFLPEEVPVLQPLFERTHFRFEGNGWSGHATLDAEWFGDDLEVEVQAESPSGPTVRRCVTIRGSNVDQMAVWFRAEDRSAAALKLCTEEAPRRERPQPTAPATRCKRRSQSPKADPFRVDSVRRSLAVLLQILPVAERASVEAGLATLRQPGLRSDQLDGVVRDVDAVAQRTVSATMEEIASVDEIRCWDAPTLARAVALASAVAALREAHVFSYAPGVNEFLALTAAAVHPREVAEIVPGWFIARGSDGCWHGASSSTGFFSGCGSDKTVAFMEAANAVVTEHLCTGHTCTAALGSAEKAGHVPGDLAAWVRASGGKHDPELLRQVGRRLMGARETDNLAHALPLVAAALATPVDKQTAQALFDALQSANVADRRWATLAEEARAALTKRFGVVPAKAAKDAQSTMLDEDDDAAGDVDDQEPEDEESEDDA